MVALATLSQCGGSDITLPGDPGPATITKLQGDNQNGQVGTELADPLVVQVTDGPDAGQTATPETWMTRTPPVVIATAMRSSAFTCA